MLPEPLRAWCESVISGPFTVTGEHSHDHGEAQVWRLQAGHDAVYLKSHRQTGKWHGEVHAYACGWTACFGRHASRLRAVRHDEPRAVLLTELAGVPMERVPLSPEQETAAWEAAGRALATLHALTNPWFGACCRDGAPQGAAEADPARFVLANLHDSVERCLRAHALSPDEEEFARAKAGACAAVFAGEQAVPCHRDYSPRNWLVTPGDGVWRGAIDWEHARWDVRARDLSRWWDREFLDRPDLARAFFDGYGSGPPTGRLHAQIQAMRLANALGGIGWSVEHNDAAFLALNRAMLTRLHQETNTST